MSSDPIFDAAVATVLKHEGGFQCNPKDAGNWTGGKIGEGELKGTNGGISAAEYPDEDIANLTVERKCFLYQRDYWQKYRIGQLDGVTIPVKVMDTAVLAGPETAIMLLQRALNALGGRVAVDGAIGPMTAAACRGAAPGALLAMYRELLVSHYEAVVAANSSDAEFLAGWKTRALS